MWQNDFILLICSHTLVTTGFLGSESRKMKQHAHGHPSVKWQDGLAGLIATENAFALADIDFDCWRKHAVQPSCLLYSTHDAPASREARLCKLPLCLVESPHIQLLQSKLRALQVLSHGWPSCHLDLSHLCQTCYRPLLTCLTFLLSYTEPEM